MGRVCSGMRWCYNERMASDARAVSRQEALEGHPGYNDTFNRCVYTKRMRGIIEVGFPCPHRAQIYTAYIVVLGQYIYRDHLLVHAVFSVQTFVRAEGPHPAQPTVHTVHVFGAFLRSGPPHPHPRSNAPLRSNPLAAGPNTEPTAPTR